MSWGVQRYEARRRVHQIPTPALAPARPSHRPGQRSITSSGGRWIGVSPPLLFTHTTTPSGGEHPVDLGGEQEAVDEDDRVGDAVGPAGRRAPSASTRCPTSAGLSRSISSETSVASTRRHRCASAGV